MRILPFILALLIAPNVWGGVEFSGDTTDNISFGDIPALDDATAITLSAWIYNDNAAQDHQIFGHYSSALVKGVFFILDNVSASTGNADVYRVILRDSDQDFCDDETSENSATDGVWQHVVLVAEAGQADGIAIYINGVRDDRGSTANCSSVDNMGSSNIAWKIGHREGNLTPRDGKISEVYAWNAALNATEAALLAQSDIKGIGLQIRPANLQLYAPLDDFAGGTAVSTDADAYKDRSGNDNHGTGTDSDGDCTNVAEQVLSYP